MIEVSDVTKVYGQTVAVDHLSFQVRPGVVTGFLGPNGSGKSTTMRIILGLDRPTSGHTSINGRAYTELIRPLTEVGALLDANWVHPNRTARAHLQWLAASNHIPRSRVGEVLDLVGLGEVAGKAVGKFSLGMKQRLGLAGAVLGGPKVLLFDEPVNGLDPEGILWIRTFMKNLAAAGSTVLVSSHLLSEMAVTAEHLIVIGRGKLIADSSTKQFIDSSAQTTVRVRSPQVEQLAGALRERGVVAGPDPEAAGALSVSGLAIEQIGDLAAGLGIALHELSPQTASLEEAFMQLTGDSVQFSGRQTPGAPPGYRPPNPPSPTQEGTR